MSTALPPLAPPAPALPNLQEPQSDHMRALAMYCRKCWEDSRTYSRSVLERLPAIYDAFSMVNTGNTAAYRNNIGLPILVAMVLTDTARQADALFGGDEIIDFVGAKPSDRPIARKNALLVTNQLRDCHSFVKGVDFLNNAHLNGTAVARVGWTYLERMRKFRVPTDMGIQVMERPVIVKDGPDWENVALEDFGPQPYRKYISNMDYLQFRYWEDWDTLVEMDNSYRSQNQGQPLFLPGALNSIRDNRAPELSDLKYARLGMNPSLAPTNNGPKRSNKSVEIIEYWGLVPPEFAPDGDRNRVILMANGHTILRNDPNPHWNGGLPAISYCPAPNPSYFYGIGKGELLEPLQAAASRLMNQKLDIIDIAANPMKLVDITRAPALANINSKPGRVIPVRGNVNDVVAELSPNWQGVQHAFQEIAELREFAQMAAGISEAGTMGIGGGDRQTAREFLGRQEAANTRLGLEAQLAAVAVEDLANWFRDMNQQRLTLPAQINLIGDAAHIDEDTGLPFTDPAMYEIQAGDLIHNWSARATGPLALVSKAMRRQDAMQFLSIAGTNPVMAQMINWATFTRRITRLFPDFDTPEMLVEKVPQITQMANQIGMTPEQLAGADISSMQSGPFGGAGGQQMASAGQQPTNSLVGGP